MINKNGLKKLSTSMSDLLTKIDVPMSSEDFYQKFTRGEKITLANLFRNQLVILGVNGIELTPIGKACLQVGSYLPAKNKKETRGGARPGAGRKTPDNAEGKKVTLLLDDETVAVMKQVGNGNVSYGAREIARFFVKNKGSQHGIS